ncbi:expressed protein [Phakopsora pachyrhizi]|uniref:Expressed protein n=1 Tax=Phakopsora pachyrhizi TaxID=170000 RepID=A0AAV0B5D0_PHAPC|nr:expressed protein [Phakopsora pachyrhizi]
MDLRYNFLLFLYLKVFLIRKFNASIVYEGLSITDKLAESEIPVKLGESDNLEKNLELKKPERSKLFYSTESTSWFPLVFLILGQGHGIRNPRSGDLLTKYEDYVRGRSKEQINDDIWAKFKLSREPLDKTSVNELPLIDENIWNYKRKLVVLAKCDFPWSMPKGVEHNILWYATPDVTAKSFELKLGEQGIVPERFKDPKRIPILMDYLQDNELMGYFGIDDPKGVELIENLPWGRNIHPGKQPWKHKNGIDEVTIEEGKEAIKWAGRHITNALKRVCVAKIFVGVINIEGSKRPGFD